MADKADRTDKVKQAEADLHQPPDDAPSCNNTCTTPSSILTSSLEQLSINNNCSISSSSSSINNGENAISNDNHTTTSSPLIICDCGYGWPKEKRPRQERIRAVAKQISNFVRWQEDHIILTNKNNASVTPAPTRTSELSTCRVVVIGSKSDLAPLEKRLSDILLLVSNNNDAGRHLMQRVVFQEVDLLSMFDEASEVVHETANGASKTSTAAHNILTQYMYTATGNNMVYLSPDAEDTLDYNRNPPNVVIIGMLVDRRVALNRSKERASKFQQKQQQQQHSIEIAKLPLSQCQTVLQVTGSSNSLKDEEPLNIDTVMEIMQRWHLRCAVCEHTGNSAAIDSGAAFVEAAVDALMSHQERHPNRTLHL